MDLAELGAATQGLLTPRLLRAGQLPPEVLSRAVRKGDLVLVRPRVYAAEPLPPLPKFVCTDSGVAETYVLHVRAVLLSLGPRAVACGRTAAALRGWALLVEPARTVEVAVPHGSYRGSRPGVRVTQQRGLETALVTPVDGAPLQVTSAVATVLDCALSLSLIEAVVIADSALRVRDVSLEELARAAASLRGRRDARRVRRVLELCDPECGSVLETVLRVRMVLDGITGFGTQRTVADATGRRVLRVDFCFETARLVVEVDGQKWHQDPVRDQGLDNALAALGWRVLRYSWAQVVHDPGAVLAQIRAAVAYDMKSLQLQDDQEGVRLDEAA